jgi:hypothetical protein
MRGIETNIFPIENLGDLAANYRMYRVRGLLPEQPEYYQNRQALARKMSYALRTPATIIDRPDGPHLIVRSDAGEPESPLMLVRTTVYLDPVPGTFSLDFRARSPENDELSTRFLQFMLQAPLLASPKLWQPASGQPFFEKTPAESGRGVERYVGFAVRAVVTPSSMGLCVDLRSKFVAREPLPVRLTREQFRHWKGRHCVYRYGHRWYEVRVDEFCDLNVTEQLVPLDGTRVTLLDYIVHNSAKPIPTELAGLPHDAAVVYYSNNQRDSRAAPAGLCYPVYDTQSPEVQRSHAKMAPRPGERRELTHRFVERYLRRLRFGNALIRLGSTCLAADQRMFMMPDIEFGGGRKLSVRGTPGTQQVSLDAVGRTRAALLRDRAAGFYVTDPLPRQYLLLPQSVADSFGLQFRNDLCRVVNDLFPQEYAYDPIVISYPDRTSKTFLEQGKAIVATAREHCTKPGYGLVMIHETRVDRVREQDQLSALIIRELRMLDVSAAVHHATTATECYAFQRDAEGQPRYVIRPDRRGKFLGYLRNVALNKILLTNERWPFVLSTPLHADIVIGVDVKASTAGFTVVSDRGRAIRTACSTSSQRERLLADQVRKHVGELVRAEIEAGLSPVRQIVIHRDGRVFQTEIDGAHRALAQLKRDGLVPPDGELTLVEIAKSSLVPLRLYEVLADSGGRRSVENPQVGTYFLAGPSDGYLCVTGRAFPRPGTVQPLHVRRVEGSLSLEQCLEDVYALTTLAWTRPEDCTRHPITLKLTDRRLGEDAGEYDSDAYEFEESDTAETAENLRP